MQEVKRGFYTLKHFHILKIADGKREKGDFQLFNHREATKGHIRDNADAEERGTLLHHPVNHSGSGGCVCLVEKCTFKTSLSLSLD